MPKEPDTVVELEFDVELLLLFRVERDPQIIFIGNFGVETDPVLHYMNTCIGLKDTQEFGWIKVDPVNYAD